MKQNNQHEL